MKGARKVVASGLSPVEPNRVPYEWSGLNRTIGEGRWTKERLVNVRKETMDVDAHPVPK